MVMDLEGEEKEEEEEVIPLTTTVTDRILRLFHLTTISQYSEEINMFLQVKTRIINQVVKYHKLIQVRNNSSQ